MKKIKLNRETVRQLDDNNLHQVLGGGRPVTKGPVCTLDCVLTTKWACESIVGCESIDYCNTDVGCTNTCV